MPPVLSNSQSLFYFLPETVVAAGAIAVFLLDLFVKKHARRSAILAGTSLAVLALGAVATAWVCLPPSGGAVGPLGQPVGLFGGTHATPGNPGLIVLDAWAVLFKYFAWAVTAVGIWMAVPSAEIATERVGEYCALLLCIAVGLSLMACSTDLLMVVVAVELVSLVSYALAGFRAGSRRSSEAALKYVVYGGVASGMMVFGISYVYGLLGSTNLVQYRYTFEDLGRRVAALPVGTDARAAGELVLVVAVVLVLSGIGFKIASVPWHMWCPDVYEGAPTPFTAFLSVGPKAAGFALAVRLFYGAMGQGGPDGVVRALGDLPWPGLIGVISAATMTLGNLAALNQTNLKRLLAYSSIAHAGYLLMGLAAASDLGSQSIALYLVVYFFMNLGAFLVVGTVGGLSGSESIREFRGLSSRAPFAALAFAVFLASLVGLPPLAGFVGKFHLFKAVLDRGGTWYVVLAIVGVVNSVISVFPYWRIVRAMYLDEPERTEPIPVPWVHTCLLAVLVLGVVVFGVYFEGLRTLAIGSLRLFGHS